MAFLTNCLSSHRRALAFALANDIHELTLVRCVTHRYFGLACAARYNTREKPAKSAHMLTLTRLA